MHAALTTLAQGAAYLKANRMSLKYAFEHSFYVIYTFECMSGSLETNIFIWSHSGAISHKSGEWSDSVCRLEAQTLKSPV